MTTAARVLALACLAFPLFAEMPTLESLATRRYFVQFGGYYRDDRTWRAEGGTGIWEFDLESGARRRVRPLGTQLMVGHLAGATIAAVEDRYIVHHRSIHEFDAATNRFLRRYPAFDQHSSWVFSGAAVTETAAKRLGVPAGYYGGLTCPPQDPGPQCHATIPGLGEITYHNSRTAERYLLHRSADPSDRRLSLASFWGPTDAMRSTAFDPRRGRFWFISGTSMPATAVLNARIEFGYLPIREGAIGDPVILESYEGPSAKIPVGLVYDIPTDSLLTQWRPDGWLATRRPADLSGPEEQLEYSVPAFATLSGEVPERYVQVLPAIGNGPGANGTWWRSDVWIFNPSADAMTFSLRRVTSPGLVKHFDLPAHGSLELTDALASLGGGPVAHGGDGVTVDALVIESPYRWGEQVTVYSRTHTAADDGRGTYGQSVPAVPSRYGYSNNGTFVLDRRMEGQFRHNVGIVNDDASPLHVTFTNGSAQQTVTVPPQTVANINVDAIGSPDRGDVGVITLETGRPVPVWLSMVDNKTGDGTFVPFSNYALAGALDATIAIPAIASAPGAYGTRWRSDLYGVFEDWPVVEYTERDVSLLTIFYPAAPDQCGGQQQVNQKIPSTRYLFPDVARQMTVCRSGNVLGALEVHAGSWTTGYSRTYTTRADGGTLGDILPMYPIGGWPVQHFSGVTVKAGFRINVGLYNGLDHPVVHRLLLYDATGVEVARRELTLGARQSMLAPLSDFVGPLIDGFYGLTVLPLDAPERPGRSWAYVSIIDNATGDPTNLW